MVAHLDGHEENGSPENLSWTCRPCNTVASNTMRGAGVGRLTHQYNPAKGGAKTLGEWMQAVGAITPHTDRGDRGLASDMPVSEAVAIIRATPHSKRSSFASQLRRHMSARASERWNPAWTGEEIDLVQMARTSRSIEELARLYQYGEKQGLRPVVEAAEERAYSLGFHHGDMERRYNGAKRNLWPFSSAKKRGTIPASGGLAKHGGGHRHESPKAAGLEKSLARYKGYRVSKTSDGEYFSSLDPDSWFESLPQLKRFIDSWEKGRRNTANPSKFDKCVRDVQKKGGAVNAYAVCTAAGLRDVRRPSKAQRNAVTVVPLGFYDLQQLDAAGKGIFGKLKRNPGAIQESESVEESYQHFHGRPAQETVFEDKEVYLGPSKMWSVGDLLRLDIVLPNGKAQYLDSFEAADGSPCQLTSNRKGTQLYCRKGDQEVDLSDFGIGEPYHDFEDLGEVEMLWYYTTKDHLGDEGGEADYYHRLGEEHAVRSVKKQYKFGQLKSKRVPRPRLVYDVNNRELLFVGGEYILEVEGIRN